MDISLFLRKCVLHLFLSAVRAESPCGNTETTVREKGYDYGSSGEGKAGAPVGAATDK